MLIFKTFLFAVSAYFKSLGSDYVFDLKLAEDISLLEQKHEFLQHYQNNNSQSPNEHSKRPILTSSCPGWICYAEKTHGSWILPYISRVKSAQQIMGSIVKKHLSDKLKIPPQQIYHITVMPCFDKKLEGNKTVCIIRIISLYWQSLNNCSSQKNIKFSWKSYFLKLLGPTSQILHLA